MFTAIVKKLQISNFLLQLLSNFGCTELLVRGSATFPFWYINSPLLSLFILHFHWQGNNLSLSFSQDSTAVILTFTFPPQNHEQFCYISFCNIHFHFLFALLLSDMPDQWTYQRARVLQWYIHKGGSFSHILCLINCQWYTFNIIHTQIQWYLNIEGHFSHTLCSINKFMWIT